MFSVMRITDEINLTSFEFWSGGKDRAMMLTYEEMEMVEDALTDLYPDGMTATELNDLMWFEFGFVCECIGLKYDEEEDIIIRE